MRNLGNIEKKFVILCVGNGITFIQGGSFLKVKLSFRDISETVLRRGRPQCGQKLVHSSHPYDLPSRLLNEMSPKSFSYRCKRPPLFIQRGEGRTSETAAGHRLL